MKYIDSFEFFINEQTKLPEFVTSDSNRIAELKKMIQDYNTKKLDIENIYKIKDPNQRIQKLKASKYLKPSVGQPNNVVFSNDLLKIWAEICELKNQLTDMDLEIKDKDIKLKAENQLMKNQDLNVKKTATNNIEQIKKDIQNLNDKRTLLNRQVVEKQNSANKKFNLLKKELELLNLKIKR